MFLTECSALLAKNRASERAAIENQVGERFNLEDVIVMQRKVYSCDGPWKTIEERGPGQHKSSEIERDIVAARDIIRAGL